MTNNELFQEFYHQFKCDNGISKEVLLQNGYAVQDLHLSEPLPCTPTKTGFVDECKIFAIIQEIFGSLCNMGLYPVVYEGENDGRLLRHVVPLQGKEDQISSYGSKESFLPHVDNPDLALRSEIGFREVSPCPDTLSLFCVRPYENVATSIVTLDSIIANLSEQDIILLQEPYFNVSRPASFESSSMLTGVSLLSKYDGYYISRFDYHNISTDSPSHKQALENFKQLCLDENQWIKLQLSAGQMVTFDNQRVLHTRNGFEPKFDGKDRWLIRVFGLYNKPLEKFLVSKNCNHHLKVF